MTEKDLKKIWPVEEWNRRHLQIIFGREYCPARNHILKDCIICSWASTKKKTITRISSLIFFIYFYKIHYNF